MILLGRNPKNEFKMFEGTAIEASKAFPQYDWFASFETKEAAGIARNAMILDIPVETYKLIRNRFLDKDKKGSNCLQKTELFNETIQKQTKMKDKKKIVVFSGAGISTESGIETYRGAGGVWEKMDAMKVASYEGWYNNPELMQKYHNERRKQLERIMPNEAHYILAELEQYFDVVIVTQNVDNLHERAGSTKLLHLHGEITKARSVVHSDLVIDIGYNEINPGDKAPDGYPLRPHVVWFGECVPSIPMAIDLFLEAEIVVVVGTSLQVYPAAGLLKYIKPDVPIYIIDPDKSNYQDKRIIKITEKAIVGMRMLRKFLLENHLTNKSKP